MPEVPLKIGASIGPYRLSRLLGRGGMGVVYLAEQQRPSRNVALKIIAPEVADDPMFRDRFSREIDLAARLEHPHVVPIFEAGELDGHLFIAMRYVDGSDLRDVLLREGRLSLERSLAIIGHVGGALDAAHELGLVHRDVKPGNILISHVAGGDHAYLADFGLSKERDAQTDLTRSNHIVGSLDYMPPEQIRAEPLDGRADVYALGCVLYQCVTGKTPFHGTDVAVMLGHLQEPPPTVTAERPDMPPMLDSVVATALAKDPEERYARCADLLRSARSAGAAAGAKPSPPPAPAGCSAAARAPSDWRRRVGGLPAAAVLVVVLAALTAALVARSFGARASPAPATGSNPPRATQRITVEPFTVDAVSGGRLASGITVVSRAHSVCWEHSLVVRRPDAFRCLTVSPNCHGSGCPGRIYDPCFTPPVVVSRVRVACPSESVPWTSRYHLLTPKKAPPGYFTLRPAGHLEPWGIEVTGGVRCLLLGNGRPVIGGATVNYGCGGQTYAVGAIHRTHPHWTVGLLTKHSTQVRQAGIVTAWY